VKSRWDILDKYKSIATTITPDHEAREELEWYLFGPGPCIGPELMRLDRTEQEWKNLLSMLTLVERDALALFFSQHMALYQMADAPWEYRAESARRRREAKEKHGREKETREEEACVQS